MGAIFAALRGNEMSPSTLEVSASGILGATIKISHEKILANRVNVIVSLNCVRGDNYQYANYHSYCENGIWSDKFVTVGLNVEKLRHSETPTKLGELQSLSVKMAWDSRVASLLVSRLPLGGQIEEAGYLEFSLGSPPQAIRINAFGNETWATIDNIVRSGS